MKPFIISAKQAVFGWPFYSTWNLVAYMREQQEPDGRFMVEAAMVAVLTSGVWLALWLIAGYLIFRFVNVAASLAS
jgi:hypothetical protein